MEDDDVVLDPAAVERKWAEIAPLIDRLMERVGADGEFPVEAGSVLAFDDEVAKPYHVSHVIRQCLTAGVDHMHAAKTLVVDQRVVHLAAPSSLARGALENFAVAYWILAPTERPDRVERALRWHYQNALDQHRALDRLDGLRQPTSRADQLAHIDVVAARNGFKPEELRGGYRSSKVVEFCESVVPGRARERVQFPWQLCSAFAHGRPWAYYGATERETSPVDEDGLVSIRLSSNLTLALYPLLAAMHLLTEVLRLYESRSRRPKRLWVTVPLPRGSASGCR